MGSLVLNLDGFTELRSNAEMRKIIDDFADKLESRANEICQTAGGEYEQGKRDVLGTKRPRYRASIHTGNIKAVVDNRRHNTLLKTLGEMGGEEK